MTDHPDLFRDWDSAYVLGMLSPEDRRAYERHLATCGSCSAAVADVAGLPGILSLLTREEAVALSSISPDGRPQTGEEQLARGAHEPDLVQGLARTVRRQRRRDRVRAGSFALVAAAVLGFGGLVVGSTIADHRPPASPSTTAPAARAMTELVPGAMSAELAVTEKGWGTRFDWSCTYLHEDWNSSPPTYDLVITDDTGAQTTVATWTATKSEAGGLVASTGVATAHIRSVEIRSSGVALVRTRL